MLVNENPSFCEDDQLAAIEDLVAHGIQALAIMPSESNRVREALGHLTDDLFIPIVTFNSDLIRTKRKCYVGLDNKKSGHVAAGLMSMLTGAGTFTNSVNNLRVEGFLEEIQQSFPAMELLGVQRSMGSAEEIKQIVSNALVKEPDLDRIFLVCAGQTGICQALDKKRKFL